MATAKKWGHLGNRIIAVAGIAIAVGFSSMIGLIARQSYQSAEEQGYKLASEQAGRFADAVTADLSRGFSIPKHLADAVAGMQRAGAVDRKVIDTTILSMLDAEPQAIGLWMLYEPNALDGKDDQFRLDWPRHDPTGRYSPYITRGSNGKAAQDVMMSKDRVEKFPEWKDKLTEYVPDYDKPGWGDFYYVPKTRGRDTITEPFFYEVQGKQVLESSLAVAIKDGSGKFLGVAAADLALDTLLDAQHGAEHRVEAREQRRVRRGGVSLEQAQQRRLQPRHGQAVEEVDLLVVLVDDHLVQLVDGRAVARAERVRVVAHHDAQQVRRAQRHAQVAVPHEPREVCAPLAEAHALGEHAVQVRERERGLLLDPRRRRAA